MPLEEFAELKRDERDGCKLPYIDVFSKDIMRICPRINSLNCTGRLYTTFQNSTLSLLDDVSKGLLYKVFCLHALSFSTSLACDAYSFKPCLLIRVSSCCSSVRPCRVHLAICLSISFSATVYVCPSVCLRTCLNDCLSCCLSIYQSVCLFVSLSIHAPCNISLVLLQQVRSTKCTVNRSVVKVTSCHS